MAMLNARKIIPELYIGFVNVSFIEIYTEHHFGCLYAKYVKIFTGSYTDIFNQKTNIYSSLYCLRLSKTVKVKGSRNRFSVARRVPGGLGSQTSMTFGT